MNRAEQAEFYIWAFDHGLVEVREIIEWADAVILEDISPDLAFINLALTGSKKKYEVADALLEIHGSVDKEAVLRKKFSTLYELVLNNQQNAAWVACVLFWMAADGEITDEDSQSDIYQFENGFEYILEDQTKVTKDLLSFLQRHSS